MAFSDGEADAKVFYIFLHVTDLEHIKSFPIRERGGAMLMEPKMESAMRRYVDIDAKVDVSTQEECNVPFIIEALKGELHTHSFAKFIAVDNYVVPKPQIVE